MSAMTLELQGLATQARQGNAAARQALQEHLEDSLGTLVRCALRRGTGLPAVVRWVQKNAAGLASSGGLDVTRATPRIARLLSVGLTEEFSPRERRQASDTVLGS